MKFKVNQNLNKDYNLFFIPFFLLLFFDIIEHNDSISYIDNYSRRPFLYPSLIDIFQFFSLEYFRFFLKIFQILIGSFSVIFFLKFFKKKFNPENFVIYIIYLILIIPFFNFSMPLANSILSESIAYPFFLFFLVYFLRFIFEEFDKKVFLKLTIFTFFLISSRAQFYFLLPLIAFFLIVKTHKYNKIFFVSALQIILLYLAISICQITYNKIKFSHFKKINNASFQFIAIAHFISNENDFAKLDVYPHKEIINHVNKYLINEHKYEINKHISSQDGQDNKNLISLIKNLRKNYNKYYRFYIPIIHAYEYELPKLLTLNQDKIENINILNREVFKIAISLIAESPKEYILLYLSSVAFGAGGYFLEAENFKGLFMNLGFSGSYLLLIHIFILIFYTAKFVTGKILVKSESYLLFSAFFNICNISFVCFFEPPYDRYIFYTNLIFLIFLINKIFEKSGHTSNNK